MGSIGVFDSGYGGLTVLKEITAALPRYNYKYLGDNARAPYGTRSFQTVYEYTLQCMKWFMENDCPLVILACNTASAKALRTIQQNDLSQFGKDKRILGVIRPTSEVIGKFSKSGHVGIFATPGTVQSESYMIEIEKFFPSVKVEQEACPMWVPLVENNEHLSEGADYFIEKHIKNLVKRDEKIDTILLACTHYPLLTDKIRKFLPERIQLIEQGKIVADSLKDYLNRHPEIRQQLATEEQCSFYTTGDNIDFDAKASLFFGRPVTSQQIHI